MKKVFELHQEIDIISVTLLLYCCSVLWLLSILQSIGDDLVHVSISLFLPLIFCRRRIIVRFNQLWHTILGFHI